VRQRTSRKFASLQRRLRKIVHCIFDYNYGILKKICFDNFCTIRNRNEYSTKQVRTESLDPNYVSTLPCKTKDSTKQPTAYCSVKADVCDFCRKSLSLKLFYPFYCLLWNSFVSLLWKNLLHSHRFLSKKLSWNSIYLILTRKLELNFVTCNMSVMKSSSSQVSNGIVEYAVLFPLVQKWFLKIQHEMWKL